VNEVFRFGLIGLGAGSLYALAAVGMVLVYRGSRVVNFAQGSIGMVGAFVYWEVAHEQDLGHPLAIVAGLAASAAIGAAVHLLIMKRMQDASALSRIVATLALLIMLQSAASLRYGTLPKLVPSLLPKEATEVFGATVGRDRLWIFALVCSLTLVLWAVYKFTKFGVATTAVAENPRAAASLGVSPDLVATANWAIGSALGALAAILLVPITGLGPTNLSFIVIPVLAAAVMGKFSSFPLTLAAGLAIGVAESEVTRYVSEPGWPTAIPFVLVTIVLVLRGNRLAAKDERSGRMPRLGSGQIRPITTAVVVALAVGAVWTLSSDWVEALSIQVPLAVVLVSFVVVTGYAGQISLAQMAFGGIAGLVSARLFLQADWPLELAIVAGVLTAVPVGIVIGLTGLRARGVHLAIVTLGFAIAVEKVIFGNPDFLGAGAGAAEGGLQIREPSLFGIEVGGLDHPERYVTLSVLVLVLVTLAVVNLRRGRAGRRLIAVRTNERAAASLGISVAGAKLYGFVLGGAISAIGGCLIMLRRPAFPLGQFASLNSILMVQNAVLGGVGYVLGPLVGSSFTPGGVLQRTSTSSSNQDAAQYIALAAGFLLIFMLTVAPHGLIVPLQWVGGRITKVFKRPTKVPVFDSSEVHASRRVRPQVLEVEGLTVRFGGTIALSDLSLRVGPGEVVGLIGPNGAGKSTAIDAITGFVQPASGTIVLGGERIDRSSREKRARAGLGRSFQSLELFDDLTVLENLQSASDRRDLAAYVTDLFWPGRAELPPSARAAVVAFGFGDDLGEKVEHLSYARRRMLAVARAVAGDHSIVLLDEPAAGLDDAQTAELGVLIRRLANEWGVGVLLVEHNVDMVLRTCDRVCALDFGIKIGEGTPTEIRANQAVVDAYLGPARAKEDKADAVI
jgi:sulfate-transporting ATPase